MKWCVVYSEMILNASQSFHFINIHTHTHRSVVWGYSFIGKGGGARIWEYFAGGGHLLVGRRTRPFVYSLDRYYIHGKHKRKHQMASVIGERERERVHGQHTMIETAIYVNGYSKVHSTMKHHKHMHSLSSSLYNMNEEGMMVFGIVQLIATNHQTSKSTNRSILRHCRWSIRTRIKYKEKEKQELKKNYEIK